MARVITSFTLNPEARALFRICLRGFRSEQNESGIYFTASIPVVPYQYQLNNAACSLSRVSSTKYIHQFTATLNNKRNTQVR